MSQPSPHSSAGFSTIELLIVLAILLGLSALAIPLVEMTEVRTREKLLRETLRDTRYAIDRYRAERNSFGNPYPPSVASLLEPIPPTLLRINGFPGPFLANPPLNPFTAEQSAFFWDIRDALSGTGTWNYPAVSDPRQVIPEGVYDIRVPVAQMGGWVTGLDGSRYEDW